MVTTSSPAPAEPAQIGALGRLSGALLNPRETFADIARRPSWIAPIVLLTIISVVFLVVLTQRVGWERIVRQSIEQNPRAAQQMAQLSPEERRQRVEQGARIAKITGYVIGIVGSLLFAAVVAAVLLGAFNLLGAVGVSFAASLGIVSHALLPRAIVAVLGIVVLYLKDPATIDIQNLVGSNVGAFLGSDAPRWLSTLASSLDLFVVWSILLLAAGFTAANPKKVSFGKALGVVIALYAIVTLLRVGWAAAFS